MANILVLQHSDFGGPGRLGATLRDHGFHLDIRRVDDGSDPFPPDLDNIHGVVSLGGPQSANDSAAWIRQEMHLLREAHDAGLAVIGVCLGAQLLAKALGGSVERMESPEVGFEPVSLTIPGQTDTLLAGVPWTHHAFQAHQDRIIAPEGAGVLASSERAPVQIFRMGLRTIGFQEHFEADRTLIDAVLGACGDVVEAGGKTIEQVREEAEAHYERFAVIADRMCVNLATLCFGYRDLLHA